MTDQPASNRRDFLQGKSLLRQVEAAGGAFADELREGEAPPDGFYAGPTVSLGKEAMACRFEVLLNPGAGPGLAAASRVLDLVDELEDQLSVYRSHTELSRLNHAAAEGAVSVEKHLFDLLIQCRQLAQETRGAFDPTSGPLVALWRKCKQDLRIPSDDEIVEALQSCGMGQIEFDEAARTVRYQRIGVEINLGAIGKGYALDRGAEILAEAGINDWLLHGGLSSILARGNHGGYEGWPVGIRNPLAPDKLMATLLLRDHGMGTSGSGTKFFRVGGERFGHILDPRTGWPVEGMLSVTVLAPTAALADALSTAFFVLGVEKSLQFCHNHPDVRAILVPLPAPGRRLQPLAIGVPEDALLFSPEVLPTTIPQP
ncbi:MAG: FAD:protein FMN transferase [Planctomycetales bacterium]